jgi:aspartate/tyrosine/aromatic aminotransferase
MPVVMQNAMNELQQMMQRIGRMQQEVVAEIQAEKKESGG